MRVVQRSQKAKDAKRQYNGDTFMIFAMTASIQGLTPIVPEPILFPALQKAMKNITPVRIGPIQVALRRN